MIDIQQTVERLKEHLRALTVTIGERSVRFPENLEKTAAYIQSFYENIELPVHRELYDYTDFKVANVVAKISTAPHPSRRYLLGAHYDRLPIPWGQMIMPVPLPSSWRPPGILKCSLTRKSSILR